jgi:hypothetical protein
MPQTSTKATRAPALRDKKASATTSVSGLSKGAPKEHMASVAGRRLPTIDPGFVTLNHEGFGWREWLVRLPAEAIADDLKEPGLWSRVQKHRSAMRRHDHLYLVAHDESWAAEAVVVDAGPLAAVISKPRLMKFEARTQPLFEDSTYRVKWYGDGYAAERRSDGMRMTAKVANEALAERDLARLYPAPG